MPQTVDQEEIRHFQKDSALWWDETGPFAPLHRLNPERIRYIRQQAEKYFSCEDASRPLKNLRVLDIGCGGGLVCEPLCRLGANITGLDADEQAIDVARAHADESTLNIVYEARVAEEYLDDKPDEKFDIVLALEIIEHVKDPASFSALCAELCKPGGLVIFSTLNRTVRSFGLGIIAAEYILRWVPRGTHNWNKFIRPSELDGYIQKTGLITQDLTGLNYDPLNSAFYLSNDIAVNYFLTAQKQKT